MPPSPPAPRSAPEMHFAFAHENGFRTVSHSPSCCNLWSLPRLRLQTHTHTLSLSHSLCLYLSHLGEGLRAQRSRARRITMPFPPSWQDMASCLSVCTPTHLHRTVTSPSPLLHRTPPPPPHCYPPPFFIAPPPLLRRTANPPPPSLHPPLLHRPDTLASPFFIALPPSTALPSPPTLHSLPPPSTAL